MWDWMLMRQVNDCFSAELIKMLSGTMIKNIHSCVLFSFLPPKLGMLLAEYVGAFNFMDGFTNSKKKD